jgi:DEAD/DEAH box helicase domain-containing protein
MSDGPSKRKREGGRVDVKQLQVAENTRQAASWPKEFIELDRIYRCLNTVYTFCCSRKRLATTFSAMKSGVENLTHR